MQNKFKLITKVKLGIMLESIDGVQQFIQEMSKIACPYVHCYAHRLNFVLVDALQCVSAIHNTISLCYL